jgi:hypothetical protein
LVEVDVAVTAKAASDARLPTKAARDAEVSGSRDRWEVMDSG